MKKDTHKTLHGTDISETIKIEAVGNILFENDLEGEYAIKSSGGNDTFKGTSKGDRYIYELGHGNLTIEEPVGLFSSVEDTLEISNIGDSRIIASTVGEDLVLTFTNRPANSITIKNHFSSGLTKGTIEKVEVSGVSYDIKDSIKPFIDAVGEFGHIVSFEEEIIECNEEVTLIELVGADASDVIHFRKKDANGIPSNDLLIATEVNGEIKKATIYNFYSEDSNIKSVSINGQVLNKEDMEIHLLHDSDRTVRVFSAADMTTRIVDTDDTLENLFDNFNLIQRLNFKNDIVQKSNSPLLRSMMNERSLLVAAGNTSYGVGKRTYKSPDKIFMRDQTLESVKIEKTGNDLTIFVKDNNEWTESVIIDSYYSNSRKRDYQISLLGSENTAG